MKVKALVHVRDIETDALHAPGDVFVLDRSHEVIESLVRDGVIAIVEDDQEETDGTDG